MVNPSHLTILTQTPTASKKISERCTEEFTLSDGLLE